MIGGYHSLLEHPDYNLTELVRQKEGDEIVKLATMARLGQPIPVGRYGNCLVLNQNELTENHMKTLLLKADQIIAGTNRTCSNINNRIRNYLGFKNGKLEIGDKVICLCNNWEVELDDDGFYSLANGIIGYVKDSKIINEESNIGQLSFQPDFLDTAAEGLIYDNNIFTTNSFKYDFHQKVYIMDDGTFQVKLPFIGKQPGESEEDYKKRIIAYANQKRHIVDSEEINFFNYAYCITCHKSQGSEFDKVVVFDESKTFNDPNKFLYTAITRAKKALVIIK